MFLFCLGFILLDGKSTSIEGEEKGRWGWDVVLVSGFILRGDSEEGRAVANRVLGLFMGDREKRWS